MPTNDRDDDLFVTLDPEDYERVSVPTAKEIRQVLSEGRRELREASAAPRPGRVDPKLRFR